MAAARLAVAVAVLATVAGGLWWVASSAPDGSAAFGDFRVVVVGPDGLVLADGVVRAEGTPLAVLQELALLDNLTLEVEEQPWIGSGCTAQYVVAIAGERESVTGGWNYYVRSGAGDWAWKPAGAACHRLEPGDEVEWCWVEADVCRHHAA